MKKTLSIQIFILLLVSVGIFAQGERYDVNKLKSEVKWLAKKVIGSNHYGKVAVKSGTINVDKKTKLFSSANIIIDMNNITCDDIESKEWNEKLISHLKSDDFFAVERFPLASFSLKEITKSGNDYVAKGTLKIKDLSKEISFPVSVSVTKELVKINVKNLAVNRTEFDVKYGSNSFFEGLKDKAIEDEFILNIDIVAELY